MKVSVYDLGLRVWGSRGFGIGALQLRDSRKMSLIAWLGGGLSDSGFRDLGFGILGCKDDSLG